jgi:hypothetical protein
MCHDVQQASAFTPLWQTVIGGVLALVGGLVGTYFARRVSHSYDQRRMASAFAGEVEALLTAMKAREIRKELENGKKLYENGRQWTSWTWSSERDYLTVYRNNADKIGLFDPPISGNIALFYILVQAVMESLTTLAHDNSHLNSQEYMLRNLTADLKIIDRIEEVGAFLVIELNQMAQK